MSELDIQKAIMRKLGGTPRTRLFRNNTGQAWQGTVRDNSNGIMVLQNPKPIHYGIITGGSDLLGWHSITITPDMVGKQIAVFLSVEVKNGRGKLSPEQDNFILQVNKAGGIAGVAYDVEEAEAIITTWERSIHETTP